LTHARCHLLLRTTLSAGRSSATATERFRQLEDPFLAHRAAFPRLPRLDRVIGNAKASGERLFSQAGAQAHFPQASRLRNTRRLSICAMSPPAFIEPCLPSAADRPPSGPDWIHEIKHDGYRLMARRDPIGIRLLTRNGHDWASRYPLIMEAVNRLKVRSCLIDGEAVACDETGLAVFERLRRKHEGRRVFLFAFDLLELNGADLRREPIETRKAALASLCAESVGPSAESI
jgi:ATP-dependent DNA ligase